MDDEVKKVLDMVQSGKITSEEAEKLLDALYPKREIAENKTVNEKYLKILVKDSDDTVKVNLPLNLVEVGLKIGMNFMPNSVAGNDNLKDIDWQQIIEAVKHGANGKIVDISDSDGKVKIYVDDGQDDQDEENE